MQTATCAQCGQAIPADETRCPACGAAVRTELVGVPTDGNPNIAGPPPADPTATPRGERRTAIGVLAVGLVAGILLWIWISPVWALIGFALAAVLAGVTLYI